MKTKEDIPTLIGTIIGKGIRYIFKTIVITTTAYFTLYYLSFSFGYLRFN